MTEQAAVPMNLSAERGLLGIILNANDTIFEIGNIQPADFAEPVNEELFRLIKDQIESARTVTATTLLHDAQDAVIWGDLKASEYLHRLEDQAPPFGVALELSKAIRDSALRRRLLDAMEESKRRIFAAPVSIPATKLRDEVDETISALFSSAEDLGLRKVGDVTDVILERLRTATEPTGLSVGLKGVQDLTGLLQGGKLYIIGGSPGSGKSALMGQIARHITKAGLIFVTFTPEMGAEEIARRYMAADTGISSEKIGSGYINNPEYEALWAANEATKAYDLRIDDSSKPSVAMIRGRSIRKKRISGLHGIGVDHVHYLQKPDRRMSENDALDENLENLKALSKDLGVPVMAICQFTAEALRDMAKWPHRRPTQGDILYSGTIDRHSDVTLLIHRREYFLKRNKPGPEDKHRLDWGGACLDAQGKAEIILVKKRDGIGFGERTIYFDAERVAFSDSFPRTAGSPDLLTMAEDIP